MRYGGYGDGGIGWGGWLAMVVMMVVFWGAIAWVVVTLIRHGGSRSEPQSSAGNGAMRVLDERFARGEVEEDEYQRRREILREGK
jgi:putative membrane protein